MQNMNCKICVITDKCGHDYFQDYFCYHFLLWCFLNLILPPAWLLVFTDPSLYIHSGSFIGFLRWNKTYKIFFYSIQFFSCDLRFVLVSMS